MAFSHTKMSNNRSVMPLDVRGCTRATLKDATSVYPGAQALGNQLKIFRDWNRGL